MAINFKDDNPEEEISTGHADYEKNVKDAENFISNYKSRLLWGMRIYLNDPIEIDKKILFICFRPPREAKMGLYVNAISLHQSNKEFKKECLSVFKNIQSIASNFLLNHSYHKDEYNEYD
jgi:hypothetical protein